MATVDPEVQTPPGAHEVIVVPPPELRIYSHSSLFYWWPVWATGFVLALITRLGGTHVMIGDTEVWIHPSKNLGVFFGVVLFLVILITNVTVRGMASVIVILSVLFITILFAYLGWWETILGWMPHLAAYLNLGFYLFFSTLLFLVWATAVFIYDHMSYWSLRPGQMTYVQIIGNQEKSYDTRGMVFEKISNDLFRHMILGLGSGDMHITTTGARPEEIMIHNVLFVGRQIREMQELVATKPDVVTTNHA